MKILVDTCVIIDVLTDREPFNIASQKIFLLAAKMSINAYISSKSVADIYYLVHKETHSDEKTREILKNLFSIFDIVDTTPEDCRKALISTVKDYEDAIMDETACRMMVDFIITRNAEDFKNAKSFVMTPEQINRELNL